MRHLRSGPLTRTSRPVLPVHTPCARYYTNAKPNWIIDPAKVQWTPYAERVAKAGPPGPGAAQPTKR